MIIPVYNAEKYIDRCLKSILKQNNCTLEIILIDDGSTDNSPKICDQYAAQYDFIKVFHQENTGPGSARECGVRKAQGNYITFVDADDYIAEDMYCHMLRVLQEKDADIVQCGYFKKNEHEIRGIPYEMVNRTVKGRENCARYYAEQEHVTNYLCNKVYKKDLFQNVKFPAFYLSEDYCVLTQLYSSAQSVVTISEPYYYYVQVQTSATHEEFSKKRFDQIKAGEWVREWYKNHLPKLLSFALNYLCTNIARIIADLSMSVFKEKETYLAEIQPLFFKYYNEMIIENSKWNVSPKVDRFVKVYHRNPKFAIWLYNLRRKV